MWRFFCAFAVSLLRIIVCFRCSHVLVVYSTSVNAFAHPANDSRFPMHTPNKNPRLISWKRSELLMSCHQIHKSEPAHSVPHRENNKRQPFRYSPESAF